MARKRGKPNDADRVRACEPARAVVLAVDAAATSGVALLTCAGGGGEVDLVASAAVSVFRTRAVEDWVDRAADLACSLGRPLYAVLEHWPSPFGGRTGKRGILTWLGLGEARGPWRREFELVARERGRGSPRVGRSRVIAATGRIVLADVGRWRRVMIPGRRKDQDWKELAVARAFELHGIEPGHDEAEAILIGHYGLRKLSAG